MSFLPPECHGSRLVTVLFLLPALFAVCRSCPSECRCEPVGFTVTCVGGGLKQVPYGIPPSTVVLNMSQNNFRELPWQTFKNLTKLRALYLTDNQISSLFFLPESLTTLDLSFNKIQQIPDNVFENSTLLQHLMLNHNDIRAVSYRTFAGLGSLSQLMLNHNDIKQISSHAFTGLRSLKQMTIFHNKIVSISNLVFRETPLTELLLHNNDISSLDAHSLQGLDKTLEKLTIFSNPFTDMPEQFFDRFSPHTLQMAITCSSLLELPVIKRKSIIVDCTPSPSLSFEMDHNGSSSYRNQLQRSGFFCFNNSSHTYTCRVCQPGYRGDQKGLGTNQPCISCPAGGFYQDEMGQVDCKLCRNGTFVAVPKHPGASATDCLACPQGTLTNETAGYRACKCLKDFHRLDRFGPCKPCPSSGVICRNDFANLAPNYYWKWTNKSEQKNFKEFSKNLKTEGPGYDSKFSTFHGKLPIRHKCPKKDSCLGDIDSNCSNGYQGPLCAVCRRDYFLRLTTCTKCPPMVRAVLQAAAVIVVFVLVLLAVLWGDSKKADHNRTWADVILSRFKIVVSFYQVMIAVFSALAQVRWPTAVITVARWLKYVEANILELSQLSCINSRLHFNALQQFLLVVCCNAGVTALTLLYMGIRIACIKRKDVLLSEKRDKISVVKRSCYRNIFVFLFTTYPTTCVKITEILPPACVKLCYSEGEEFCQMFLRSDFSVECFTPEHNRLWYAAAVLVLYPVGFPLLVLALLWKYYYKLLKKEETLRTCRQTTTQPVDSGPGECLQSPVEEEEPNQDTSQLVDQEDARSRDFNVHTWTQRDIPDATLSLSLFYENYRPRFWFWEVTEMYRKLVLMCGLVFIGSHSRSQIGIGVLLSGIFSVLHAAYRPIADKSENKLQFIALLVIFFDLSIGVMLRPPAAADKTDVNQQNDSLGVTVLFVAVNCLVIGIALMTAIKTIAKLCCKSRARPCCPSFLRRLLRKCRLCQ